MSKKVYLKNKICFSGPVLINYTNIFPPYIYVCTRNYADVAKYKMHTERKQGESSLSTCNELSVKGTVHNVMSKTPKFISLLVHVVRPARMRSSIPLLEPGPPRFFWWYENSE
jgi:hypothetical protein